jgi:ribosomal protein L10
LLAKKLWKKLIMIMEIYHQYLKGNTSIFISETGNAPAKIIKEFRKKSDKPF